jgi:tetratricopeptide (TPR) repeat protein
MPDRNRCAKVNVKLLVILILVVAAVGVSLVAARQVRRSILSKMSLEAGTAAFEGKNWAAARNNFQEYLGRNPDNVEILGKYAKACLSMRPLDPSNVMQGIAAYRRILQLDPEDEAACSELAVLYSGVGNFEELAYLARMRLERDPNDPKTSLWLAEALVRLNKPQEARGILEALIGRLDKLADKHEEYVRACIGMSDIEASMDSANAKTEALEWLNKAVAYAPESVEALVYRARFYRQTAKLAGVNEADPLSLARKDLEAADALHTDDPKTLYFLGTEWMAQGELDRAAAKLEAVDRLSPEKLEEAFFDVADWKVARFLFTAELASRRQAAAEAAAGADETLAALTEPRHRVQVLPTAISIYLAAGRVPEARRCLDEYVDILRAQQVSGVSTTQLAWLKALVARAEGKPYAVIDLLKPLVVTDTSRPDLWGLLAEAYSRTDQTRLAVNAMTSYLRYYPRDPEMTLQLAKEYFRLGAWDKALAAAKAAESLNPADIDRKLLRIEASLSLAVGQPGPNAGGLEQLSAELAQLRQEHPDRADIRTLQAVIAESLKQPERAEAELKLAINECKEPLRAQMQLVNHYYRAKRLPEAVSCCETARKEHPEAAEPWLTLSDLYAADADYDSARKCLTQGLDAVTGKSDKRSVAIKLALLEVVHGDRAAGIRLLQQQVAQNDQEIQARLLLLGIPEVQKDRAAAEELIDGLRKVEGESGLSWRLQQASLWLSSEDWRSKQQDITGMLQYCMTADPQWSAPVLLLAGMYERLGDLQRMEDTCRQAIARNPAATEVADRLLALLERQGRLADAETVLRQMTVDPRVTSGWQVRMALGAGDVSKAVDELKLRVSSDAQDASSRIQLARLVYQQTRDADQAFKYLKEAEAIAPASMTLVAVKASILRAEGRTQEARQALDGYVASRNAFDAYWMRAVFLAEDGDLAGAERDYEKLTTFADRAVMAYVLLSGFYAGHGNPDKAVTTLEQGLGVHPEDLILTRNLMKMLFARGRPQDRERALAILTSLEQQLPQDPELMTIRALQMAADSTSQSLKAAREKLENAVKLEPTALDAHLALIGVAMQQGDYTNARDYAVRALGSNPGNLALLSARGRAELALGDRQEAVELAHTVLGRDPNQIDALSVLAEAAMVGNDSDLLEESQTRMEAAIRRDPGNERLLILQSRVLVSLGQPQRGIPELEGYCQTEKGKSSLAAVVTLADLYRLSGEMDKSMHQIERAEQLDPNGLTPVHARFLWLVSQNRQDELAHISSAYLSAKTQDPAILLAAASRLAMFGPVDIKKEGLKLFERAIALEPTSVNARVGLASTLYQTGDAERAKEIYRELLKQNPNDVRVLNDLAWVLQEHDRSYDAALEMANKGLSLAPNDLHLLDTRGTILTNMADRLADARSDFRRLVELSPPDSDRKAKALLQLGRVCAKLNDAAEARQRLQEALRLDEKLNVFTPDERSEITQIVQ